ncbi:hypothetical protein BDB00DRAFT_876374 [Zychaea mexicana]|uniref:uncharacterized protein n=1 Tax=Zychaea mexicana TaxID=64656 RepID=UPI0022FF180E|nr:uncharacterized protein BDB00DRAFT_876374 [Zychaea mexicana]KAI9489386.1 hypothetical protein BDB00DRAFT_876374 [Zychaea mexicana]
MVCKQANSVIAQVAQKQIGRHPIAAQLLQEKIVESLATKKNVGVIGVDPGLVVSATSITTTAKDLHQTIVSYTRPQPSSSPSSSSAPETAPTQPSDLPSVARPLPPAQTYTAKKKTAATLEAAHQARREQYKKKHDDNTGDQDRRQNARTRDIRHNVFHRKLVSSWRATVVVRTPPYNIIWVPPTVTKLLLPIPARRQIGQGQQCFAVHQSSMLEQESQHSQQEGPSRVRQYRID